jgi:hypothetical protein
VFGNAIKGDLSMRKSLLAGAAGIAATLALITPDPARAALVFTPTTFNGNKAVIDDTSHLGWVTPNIAANDTFAQISALCSPTCTGPLAGLTWATNAQVQQFWLDTGIPLNSFGSYSAAFTAGILPPLINALGPTHTASTPLIGTTDTLGGITNNPETLGIPNTSYMFHFFSVLGSGLDNESAFITGAGNGFAQDPATGGWFFFTPASAVPEPSTWAMMLIGFLGLGFAFRQSRRKISFA